jgi:hypothetical protein
LGTFVGLAGRVSPSWAEWGALVCTGAMMVVASLLLEAKAASALVPETKRAEI